MAVAVAVAVADKTRSPVPVLLLPITIRQASSSAEEARSSRDSIYETISSADAALDASLLVLADRLVAAGLGARKNPFASFSPHSPARLTDLPYATELKEARALLKRIAAKKPAADVQKQVATCSKAADAVEKALASLSRPQSLYQKALAARDGLVLAWTKALSRLKKHAAATWDDDVATYRATFAPAAHLQAPKRRAKKKKPAVPTTPA